MKSLLKIGLLAGVGLLVINGRALASGATFDLPDISGASGEWHVMVQSTGAPNTFDVFYQATAGTTPADLANTVNISFFTGGNATGSKLTVAAGTVGGAPPGDAVLFSSSAPLPYYAAGAQSDLWTPVALSFANGVAKWQASTVELNPNGDNWLEAQVVVTGGTAASVRATVQDDTVWAANANLVPEPASVALLLPGLIPVGLLLRRRKASANAVNS